MPQIRVLTLLYNKYEILRKPIDMLGHKASVNKFQGIKSYKAYSLIKNTVNLEVKLKKLNTKSFT